MDSSYYSETTASTSHPLHQLAATSWTTGGTIVPQFPNPVPINVASPTATAYSPSNSSDTPVAQQDETPPGFVRSYKRSSSQGSEYRQPPANQLQAMYRNSTGICESQLRRQRSLRSRRNERIRSYVHEVGWILLGLRHFIAEVPLIAILALQREIGALFTLTVIGTLLPGAFSLISILRSGAAQGTSVIHGMVRCIAYTLRAESIFRLLELLNPRWRNDGVSWRPRVALAAATTGSVFHLLMQSSALGWCMRPREVLPKEFDSQQIVVFRKAEKVIQNLWYEQSCDTQVTALQSVIIVISSLHVSWALVMNAKPVIARDRIAPSFYRLTMRTSMALGILANVLISVARAALLLISVAAGWDKWHVAAICVLWMVFRLLVDLMRYRRGKAGPPDMALVAASLVAVEPCTNDTSEDLFRRCLRAIIQNTLIVLAVGIRARGAETAIFVYRVSVLHALATITGMLLLIARLRWVLNSSGESASLDKGKCLGVSERVQQVDT